MIKPALLLALSVLFYACNTDETPRAQVAITSFGVPGVGEFEFSDDNILLLDPSQKLTVDIHTDPPDAIVSCSLDNREFFPLEDLPVITDFRKITFIASKSNYRQSHPKSLRIGHVSARYLKDFGVSPDPVKDSLHLRAVNKSRGVVSVTVFTPGGTKLLQEVLLKQKDTLHYARDVSSYDPGVYLMQLGMGSGEEHLKFIVK